MQVVQLDPATAFKPVGAVGHGVVADPSERGWEVPGDTNNLSNNVPYVEGSWVTQRAGRYYWSYSSPGTQYKSYADGIFTAPNASGPWTYELYNPISSKVQ